MELRAANIMWGQVDAVEDARERGLINSLLEPLKYENAEVMNEEKFSALQDAACGALLNMWCGLGLFPLLSIPCESLVSSRVCGLCAMFRSKVLRNWESDRLPGRLTNCRLVDITVSPRRAKVSAAWLS